MSRESGLTTPRADQPTVFRADSAEEHLQKWRQPSVAWTIGLPSWAWQRAAEWYDRTKFSKTLRVFESLGVVIAIFALICTVLALGLTVEEVRLAREVRDEERRMRQATLLAVLYERLQEARRTDADKAPKDKHARAGQIPILQELVRLKSDLSYVDASGVNLTPGDKLLIEIGVPGIALDEGRLRVARLNNSNLAGAQMVGADLWKANFDGSYLQSANFTGADLSYATFDGANVDGANFSGVKGLTQQQLDSACASAVGPENLPEDAETKRQLIWSEAKCDESGPLSMRTPR